jgi:hypothetical protein
MACITAEQLRFVAPPTSRQVTVQFVKVIVSVRTGWLCVGAAGAACAGAPGAACAGAAAGAAAGGAAGRFAGGRAGVVEVD